MGDRAHSGRSSVPRQGRASSGDAKFGSNRGELALALLNVE
jgi:hypothetical protein